MTLDLSSEHRLRVLRRVDIAHPWTSLAEKRRCRSCGDVFKGWEIGIAGGTRADGPLRLCCPGLRCNAGPEAWEPVSSARAQRDVAPRGVTVTHGGRAWTVRRQLRAGTAPATASHGGSERLRDVIQHLIARIHLFSPAQSASPARLA
jgi:rubredoxin